MPKNKGRGGKNYKRGKNENETKRELLFAEDGESYAQVVKMLGNERVEVITIPDGKKRMALIRGKLRKKVWIMQNDIVLCGLWDFQEDQCHIIHKFTPDEVRQLIKLKEVPENVKVNDQQGTKEQIGVDFVDDIAEDEDPTVNTKEANITETQNKNQLRYKNISSSSSDEEDEDEAPQQQKSSTNKEKDMPEQNQPSYNKYKNKSQVHQQKEFNTDQI